MLGRVDARPEFVYCMVEGLPPESRYKIFSLPNPQGASRESIEYEASQAHANVLMAQQLLSWSGEKTKPDDVMPPWVRSSKAKKKSEPGSRLKELNAAFMGGIAAFNKE